MEFDWIEHANCLGYKTRIFFDDFEVMKLSDRLNVIKICLECEVKDECLSYGESQKDAEGIFGGKFFKRGVARDPFRVKPNRIDKEVPVKITV